MRPLIHKAVIPVAGRGTRLRPISAVVPKAMMPVPDAAGRVLPVLHHVLAEAAAGGADEAAVVVSPGQDAMLRDYLDAAREAAGGPCPWRPSSRRRTGSAPLFAPGLPELPRKIAFLVQEEPLGFGHAVWLARRFVGEGPFLVLLGDHVHVPRPGAEACAAQVARAFARHGGAAMVGMQAVGAEELPRVGVAGGAPLGPGGSGVYRCMDFVEKPDLATARRRLRTPGLKRDCFLAHCGIYAFDAEIFDCLEELMSSEAVPRAARGGGRARAQAGERKEVQLADAQSILLRRRPREYYLLRVAGAAHDTGTPAGYLATWKALLSRATVR